MRQLNSLTLPFTASDIQEILPHRYPFLFIDKVVEFVDRGYIVAVKNVSVNEPFFLGHFPGQPILPGVIILEALAQLGCLFAKLSTGGCPPEKLMVFTGAEDVRFKRQVIPGDVLTLRVQDFKSKFGHWKIGSVASVGDELAATATLMAAEVSV